MADKSLTAPFLTIYEMAAVLSRAAELISRTISGKIFGEEIKHGDSRVEAVRLLKERKLPFVVQRQLIPNDPSTIETIPIKELAINQEYLDEVVTFLIQNSLPITNIKVEDLAGDLESFNRAQEQVFTKELMDPGTVSDED